MKILYIHGANSTGGSWNYIRERVDRSDLVVDYPCTVSFYHNLKSMKKFVAKGDWFLVGHSLGGIYALHLWDHLRKEGRCKGGLTISTPYGGSALADLARLMFPWFRLFSDVGVSSKPVLEAQCLAHKLNKGWTQVVTTTGHTPYLPDKNDGVVTIVSQIVHTDNMNVIRIDSNHYEVLQDPRVPTLLQERISLCE